MLKMISLLVLLSASTAMAKATIQDSDVKGLPQVPGASSLIHTTKLYDETFGDQLSKLLNVTGLAGVLSAPNGYVLTANGSGQASWAQGGGGGGGLPFQQMSSDGTLSINTAYGITKSSSPATLTLPSTCGVNDRIQINGMNTYGWKLVSNTAVNLNFYDDNTTRGALAGDPIPVMISTSGHSQVELVCEVANTDWAVRTKNGTMLTKNYYGDSSDGDVEYTTNTNLVVPNKNGPYDGEAVVKNYHNLTIDAGVTLTTDQPGRGMILYVSGDLVVNGSISMFQRGPNVNPSDVGATALTFRRFKRGGSDNSTTGSTVTGMGSAAESAEANQSHIVGGLAFTIPCVGGAGGQAAGNGTDDAGVARVPASCAAPGSDPSNNPQFGAQRITNGTGGGGGGGANNGGQGGSGTAGTCFAGGSSGGAGGAVGQDGSSAKPYAGMGGGSSFSQVSGGCGNPAGNLGNTGVGGLVIIFVRGNITIAPSGNINANGSNSPGYPNATGGGSGGGVVALFYGGTLVNNGTVTANGGTTLGAGSGCNGGVGASGTVLTSQIDR